MIRQHEYILKYAEEIRAAIANEYPPDAVYISSRYISQQILGNPGKYPMLGGKTEKGVRTTVGLYLSKTTGFKEWSSHMGHRGTVYKMMPKMKRMLNAN